MEYDYEMIIEYDDTSKNYCIFWRPPVVIGTGETEVEALEDVRKVARFSVETEVDLKSAEIGKGI